MNKITIKEKTVQQYTFISKNQDPIHVWIDEKTTQESNETRFAGRMVVVCYDVALNHFWDSMGCPMKEFFVQCDTGYILSKFENNVRNSMCQRAYDVILDKQDNITKTESDAIVEMSEFQKENIKKIIEIIKQGFVEILAKAGKK